jgi:hypothetical protein
MAMLNQRQIHRSFKKESKKSLMINRRNSERNLWAFTVKSCQSGTLISQKNKCSGNNKKATIFYQKIPRQSC